jgi:AraC-like DNA-binding protein
LTNYLLNIIFSGMRTLHFELFGRNNNADLNEFGFGLEWFPAFKSAGKILHTHDLVELVYVCRGEGTHILGDREVPAMHGSLAIIHRNQMHGFKTGPGGLDLINLYLDINRFPLPLMPEGLQNLLPLIIPLHPRFRHNLRNVIHLRFDNPEEIEGLLLKMRSELAERREGFRESLQHMFTLFLIEACRCYRAQQKQSVPEQDNERSRKKSTARIERLCRHLDSHFSESLTLDELARLTGLQKNYLCRAFKAHTGQTVLNYILQQRLGQAMLLLRQTDRPVVDIAIESGFNDLPHFNRTFRREVEMTPREYRRQWQ